MGDERPSVEVEALTEAAFAGVLRALDARKMRPEQFPGPILVGIIWWPELSQLGERLVDSAVGQREE
jgi:hypothetical protein